MPIDPQAKLAKLRRLEAQRAARPKRRVGRPPKKRAGPLTTSEKTIIAQVVADAPATLMDAAAIERTAHLMRRDPRTVAHYIVAAREQFQANARRYVEIHQQVADAALKDGSDRALDVARKASEFAMQHASAKDKSGKVERIIESQQTVDVPRVQIGVVLGGLPTARPAAIIDAE